MLLSSRVDFHVWFSPDFLGLLVAPRSKPPNEHELAEVSCVCCEDSTSKDPFSRCENLQNLQGIHMQVKSEHVGTIDNK